MSVLDHAMGCPLAVEEQASAALAGGISLHGYQCGMLWGAALAAGAQAYRLFGPGEKAETAAIIAGQRLVASFRDLAGRIDCLDITGIDMRGKIRVGNVLKFIFIKGGMTRFFSMTVGYARKALDDINLIFTGKDIEAARSPVSCSAMMLRKAGASDMHTVMAAGLAGGIGLSGGGCGALGAAIWLNAIKACESGKGIGIKNPRASDIINTFLESTGFKVRCSEIVGRRFESVDDHAGYLRGGGCSEIIELLATESSRV